MQSTYSWMGTPLHLVLEDDIAANYNRAQDAFFQAQENHEKTHGIPWNGQEPIAIEWTEGERLAFDKIAQIINLLVAVNGGTLDIPEEEMTSDYLIKIG